MVSGCGTGSARRCAPTRIFFFVPFAFLAFAETTFGCGAGSTRRTDWRAFATAALTGDFFALTETDCGFSAGNGAAEFFLVLPFFIGEPCNLRLQHR
jgi:hypothetical protein